MIREQDGAVCVLCGGTCNTTIVLADGSFPVNSYECIRCGDYGLSYTLWFRLKLGGWSLPAIQDIRDRLSHPRDGNSRPLVIMRVESREAARLKESEVWKVFVVD